MIVDTSHTLIPQKTKAHTVIIRDDLGNPLFAAMHLADGIVYSSVGEKDFAAVLKMIGNDDPPIVHELAKTPA